MKSKSSLRAIVENLAVRFENMLSSPRVSIQQILHHDHTIPLANKLQAVESTLNKFTIVSANIKGDHTILREQVIGPSS
ncbi:hypothetical protein Acr_17g0002810 [Actinidia rufa]|uniref:Uncharacterized protein n=1 Tax=Actinidia rufa TaxID=165716 RepID=A0A7J0G1S2_9ERIC|nr:hypothetical protein Acr_17g0002810 [Actinidia rufa]